MLIALGLFVAAGCVASRWLSLVVETPAGVGWAESGVVGWQSGLAVGGFTGWQWIVTQEGRGHSQWWLGWEPAGKWNGLDRVRSLGVWRHDYYSVERTDNHIFSVVLWPVPPLLCWAGVIILRRGLFSRMRARKGECIDCGYSRMGLPTGVACPECGSTPLPLRAM